MLVQNGRGRFWVGNDLGLYTFDPANSTARPIGRRLAIQRCPYPGGLVHERSTRGIRLRIARRAARRKRRWADNAPPRVHRARVLADRLVSAAGPPVSRRNADLGGIGPAPMVEPVAVPSQAAEKSTPRVYHRTRKPRKKVIHWWRSWTYAFASVWTECEIDLDGQPDLAATVLLERLQARYPEEYPDKLLRTLQRRVRAWRIAHVAGSSTIEWHGDSLPDTDDIEWSLPFTEPSADSPPRYDFE